MPLPVESQFSNVYAILVEDFTRDNKPDILLGGNNYRVKPEVGRYDASFGLLLEGRGDGTFTAIGPAESGVSIHGEIRDLQMMRIGNTNAVLVLRNNDRPLFLLH